MRGGPRIARSSRPQAALPFSPRSPTAAKAGSARAKAAATINSICHLAAGACRSSLACSATGKAAASGARTATRLRLELKTSSSTWAVGGRAGYLVTPRFLTFFDGGFTQARFDQINYNFSIAGGGPTGVNLPGQTYNGWFIGSGYEYAFDWLPIPGIFWKTEYRYSQYNSATPSFVTTAGVPTGFSLNTTKFTQFVSTELVWRFNWFGGHY